MYQSLEIEPIRFHFGHLNKYVGWAPLKWMRESEAASIRSMQKGVRMVNEYKQDPERKRAKDLLGKMLDATDASGNSLPEELLNVQSTSFILAGSHTTSSSLTWIVWRILRHPDVLKRLNEELDEALANDARQDVPLHHQLEKLPWLNAIIKEGLRIDTAVPGSTPRYVPASGAVIAGHTLPAGATVSVQAYSLHRDPEVFPDPERFLPERWLSETPQMNRLYVPFGADGPRKCIGIHLAYVELRVILAGLFHRFDLQLVEENDTDTSMEMHELWLAAPQGQRLSVLAKPKI
jgi:cytochrome P450